MNSKTILKKVWVVVLSGICLTGFYISGAEGAKVIRVATQTPPESLIDQGMEKWKSLMEERSGGKLNVKVLGRAIMGSEREVLEGCRMGTLDAGIISAGMLGNIIPQFFIVAMPYLFNNHDEANAFLDGPVGQKLFKMLEGKDLVSSGYATYAFRGVWNNKGPITKPDDLKGLKIRTLENPLDLSIMTHMGGIAVPLAWSETVIGLRQGLIDGISVTYGLGYQYKLYEHTKYVTQTKHFYEPAILVINKKLFNTFSPEEQKIIKETAAEAQLWGRREQMQFDEKAQSLLEGKGMKVNSLSPEAFSAFRERTKIVYEQFRLRIGSEFMDEALAFVNSLRKK